MNETKGLVPGLTTSLDVVIGPTTTPLVDVVSGPTTTLEVMTVILILSLMILGIHFNSLVLYMFCKHRHYRLPSRLQLFSLAVDDIGTAIFVEPMVISMFYKIELFAQNNVLCRIFSNLLHIFPWGSIISLMVLSFTRVVIVLYPLAYKIWVTRRRVVHVIVAKYLFIGIFLTVSNPLWTFIFIPSVQSCFVSYAGTVNDHVPHVNVIPYIILIGSVIIVLLSGVVLAQFCGIPCRRGVGGGLAKHRAQMPGIARELLLLVAVYLMTTFSVPMVALKHYLNFNLSPQGEVVFAQVAKVLFYVGPVANPVIYALRRGEYRDTLASSFKLTISARRIVRERTTAKNELVIDTELNHHQQKGICKVKLRRGSSENQLRAERSMELQDITVRRKSTLYLRKKSYNVRLPRSGFIFKNNAAPHGYD